CTEGTWQRESAMRVLFQSLRECPELRRILQTDGWKLEGVPNDALLGEHPAVSDEEAARGRLHRLGLLTSGRFRIQFLSAGEFPLRETLVALPQPRALPQRLTAAGPRCGRGSAPAAAVTSA